MFASEIIRTGVGSIGLVLAVPLTTLIGVAVVRASGRGLPRGGAPLERTAGAAADFEPQGTVLAGLGARLRSARGGKGTDGSTKDRKRRNDDDFGNFDYLKDDAEPIDGDSDGGKRR